MSIFDSIKNALGGGKSDAEPDVSMAPSQVLQKAGIDTSRLDLTFGTNSIGVGGEIANEAERDRILDILSGLPGIESIEDSMMVAAPESEPSIETEAEDEPEPEAEAPSESQADIALAPAHQPEPEPEPQPEPQPEPEATESSEDGARTYTVKPGDTIWKIAEEVYGSGSNYTAIFEANRDLLENPDRVSPGQVLKIPDLD